MRRIPHSLVCFLYFRSPEGISVASVNTVVLWSRVSEISPTLRSSAPLSIFFLGISVQILIAQFFFISYNPRNNLEIFINQILLRFACFQFQWLHFTFLFIQILVEYSYKKNLIDHRRHMPIAKQISLHSAKTFSVSHESRSSKRMINKTGINCLSNDEIPVSHFARLNEFLALRISSLTLRSPWFSSVKFRYEISFIIYYNYNN